MIKVSSTDAEAARQLAAEARRIDAATLRVGFDRIGLKLLAREADDLAFEIERFVAAGEQQNAQQNDVTA